MHRLFVHELSALLLLRCCHAEFFNPNAASVDAEGNQILAGKGQCEPIPDSC
jgi:hypothetical protein